MNDARFSGNLTRDPETKVMTNGNPRTMFTLAVQRKYVNQQTGKREADFITFIAYDKNAEIAAKYLAKGRKVLVTSHVKTGNYQKDGKTIYTTEFVVDTIEFLTSSQERQEDTPPPNEEPPAQSMGAFTEMDDDELPF